MSEEQKQIPTSKIARAMKFATTGAKMGGNYLKHYAGKAMGSNATDEDLDKANAETVFQAFGELKGSALKAAQMMSMDKNILPKAYVDKFALAQYNAPALSYPLVVKTFQQYFQKSPLDMFDEFSKDAVHAASIGQVHAAMLNGKKLAVKVQYPGVADSVVSDLNMVKPVAMKIMNANEHEIEEHFKEISERLLEETDYKLELQRSLMLSEKCASLQNIRFTNYYPELSCERILTMDWLEGKPVKEFVADNPSQEICNKAGQAIWNFYTYQVHTLHIFHADPHPGNFLINENGNVGIIDFGCVKQLPESFYRSHMRLIDKDIVFDDEKLMQVLKELHIIFDDDSTYLQQFLFRFLAKTIRHIVQPFFTEYFDFGNEQFINDIINKDELFDLKMELLKSRKSRGQRDALYLHRTYFGLFNILHELKAIVKTNLEK
jgi:predicted unusual protein kinase regulating ubiquinone biosynthesis (AarF/ABC1/UbiB family)